MKESIIVYSGVAAILVGLVFLICALAKTRSSTTFGWLLLALGIGLFVAGLQWPAADFVVTSETTGLDHFVPRYQFHEVHQIRVRAPRERVYRVIRQVSADEIFLFRTLTWIRRAGKPLPEGILNPPTNEPILDLALRTSFRLLAEEPNHEIVIGTAVIAPPGWKSRAGFDPEDFRREHSAGFALAAMNFRVEELGPNESLVTTETRVFATDADSRRRFARYWRLIYPGSALIRRMWLRAIRERSLGPS